MPARHQRLDGEFLRLLDPKNGGLAAAQKHLDARREEGFELHLLGTNLAVFVEVPQPTPDPTPAPLDPAPGIPDRDHMVRELRSALIQIMSLGGHASDPARAPHYAARMSKLAADALGVPYGFPIPPLPADPTAPEAPASSEPSL